MEDREIVELYFKRDETAITETDAKYGLLLKHISMGILGVSEDAEECVNDTYNTAWNRMPPVVPVSLRAFLGRITRDLSISRFRALRAKKRFAGAEIMLDELGECVAGHDGPETGYDSVELGELISRWLDTLQPDDRAMFVRRYWYGDTVRELAGKCGCTQNNMAQRMFRLRAGLKTALESEGILL